MSIYSITITLFLVMNPLGNIPVFITALKDVSSKRRFKIILREAFFAFIILSIFLFAGDKILNSLQITESALGIAGGLILLIIAIRLIFPASDTDKKDDKIKNEPFLVPLAIPLFAGPAAMTTLMLLVDQPHSDIWLIFLSLIISWGVSSGLLLASTQISRLLGKQGLAALERLMGMILTAIAVQMFLTGIRIYFSLPQ